MSQTRGTQLTNKHDKQTSGRGDSFCVDANLKMTTKRQFFEASGRHGDLIEKTKKPVSR